MLFNPDWSKQEVKADPFKLETLIAWLEKQPAASNYPYMDGCSCMFAQYLSAHGFSEPSIGGVTFSYQSGNRRKGLNPFPTGFPCVASGWPHTFGAALERARALQAATENSDE